MKYPTHLQYIETLSNAHLLCTSLGDLRLSLNHNGEPIFSSGNFGAVFKITISGRTQALKCFTRDEPHRSNAYRLITNGLPPTPPYIIPYQFLEDELTVFDGPIVNRFPALLMDWVDGDTMTTYLRRAIINHNIASITKLAQRFDALAHWLLASPMAHGDLKPDNIMVRPDGSLTLIDYDGAYLPSMKGSPQRELGTPEFQHPLRDSTKFDKSIDHYSMAVISLTLHTLALDDAQLNNRFICQGSLFTPALAIHNADPILNHLKTLATTNLALLIDSLQNPTAHIPNIQNIIPFLTNSNPKNTPPETLNILSPYKENEKFGFVNQFNAIIIPAQFDEVLEFSENLAPICINNLWGYINSEGRITIPPIYHYAAPFSEGLAAVAMNNKFGYIQMSGQSITTLKFDNAWSFHNGRGLIKKGGKYGFIDPTGKTVISAKYQFARSFNENIACIQIDNLYGYIDINGRQIIKPKYSFASSVHDGVAEVEHNGMISYIEVME